MNAARARALPSGAYVARVRGDADAVDVIPGRPEPAQDPRGRPILQIVDIGTGALLQAEFRWPVPEEAIRAGVGGWFAGTTGTRTAVRSVVDHAELVVERIDTRAEGGRAVLARATASGYPPYAAMVSAALDEAAATAVRRALAGEAGLVRVTYRGRVAAGVEMDDSALQAAAAQGVQISRDRTVTATSDLADWAHRGI